MHSPDKGETIGSNPIIPIVAFGQHKTLMGCFKTTMKEDDEYSKLCIRGLWKGTPKSHRVEIGKKIQKSLGVEITCFDENREQTLTFPSIRTAAKHYGFGINTISKLVSGKLLSYKGISVITPD